MNPRAPLPAVRPARPLRGGAGGQDPRSGPARHPAPLHLREGGRLRLRGRGRQRRHPPAVPVRVGVLRRAGARPALHRRGLPRGLRRPPGRRRRPPAVRGRAGLPRGTGRRPPQRQVGLHQPGGHVVISPRFDGDELHHYKFSGGLAAVKVGERRVRARPTRGASASTWPRRGARASGCRRPGGCLRSARSSCGPRRSWYSRAGGSCPKNYSQAASPSASRAGTKRPRTSARAGVCGK